VNPCELSLLPSVWLLGLGQGGLGQSRVGQERQRWCVTVMVWGVGQDPLSQGSHPLPGGHAWVSPLYTNYSGGWNGPGWSYRCSRRPDSVSATAPLLQHGGFRPRGSQRGGGRDRVGTVPGRVSCLADTLYMSSLLERGDLDVALLP